MHIHNSYVRRHFQSYEGAFVVARGPVLAVPALVLVVVLSVLVYIRVLRAPELLPEPVLLEAPC